MTPEREQEIRERAGRVLEAMSQDSGPESCEPYTGWCVDLARDVAVLCDAFLLQQKALTDLRSGLTELADMRDDAEENAVALKRTLDYERGQFEHRAALAALSPTGTPDAPEYPNADEFLAEAEDTVNPVVPSAEEGEA